MLCDNGEFSTTLAGYKIRPSLNSKIQKAITFRILSNKYEEKKAKYYGATPAYKQTAEYERLGRIVTRLHATLVQMEEDMAR